MPGCIPCKTHVGGMPVAPQGYASVEDWSTLEVQRTKELKFAFYYASM